MRRRGKVIIILLVAMYIVVGIYGFITQVEPIRPPETLKSEIVIDLQCPYEGVIHITNSEDKISRIDYDVVIGSNRDAWEILDQYCIPYKDPYSIKPNREKGKVTVSLNFVAENKYEFVWPVCTFNSTWVQMWQGADFTVILPEGYEIVDIATENAVKKPKRRFVDDRWEIETKTLENSEFQIEITYKKEE